MRRLGGVGSLSDESLQSCWYVHACMMMWSGGLHTGMRCRYFNRWAAHIWMWTCNPAGALNFVGSHALFGRNWGCAYGLRIKHLHFELCYYQVTTSAESPIQCLFASSLVLHVGYVGIRHRPKDQTQEGCIAPWEGCIQRGQYCTFTLVYTPSHSQH